MLVLKLSNLISWLCGSGLTPDDESPVMKAEYQQYLLLRESLFKQRIYDILDIMSLPVCANVCKLPSQDGSKFSLYKLDIPSDVQWGVLYPRHISQLHCHSCFIEIASASKNVMFLHDSRRNLLWSRDSNGMPPVDNNLQLHLVNGRLQGYEYIPPNREIFNYSVPLFVHGVAGYDHWSIFGYKLPLLPQTEGDKTTPYGSAWSALGHNPYRNSPYLPTRLRNRSLLRGRSSVSRGICPGNLHP